MRLTHPGSARAMFGAPEKIRGVRVLEDGAVFMSIQWKSYRRPVKAQAWGDLMHLCTVSNYRESEAQAWFLAIHFKTPTRVSHSH
jgi:hypothetical protein